MKLILGMGILAFVLCGCSSDTLLKDKYEDYFNIGAALSKSSAASYSDELLQNFNIVVAENEMKWSTLQPNEGQFRFDSANAIVQRADEIGASIRGHVLMWHQQTPNWVFRGTLSDVQNRLHTHIETVLTEYKGRVTEWDVANEVLSDNHHNPDELFRQDSKWYEACGKDDDVFVQFLADAFKKAKEVDPSLQLYYNDYSLNIPEKCNKAVTLIQRLKEAGAPIDGIGMQGHYNIHDFNADIFAQCIDKFIAEDMKVAITELDLSIYPSHNYNEIIHTTLPPDLETAQAEIFNQIFEVARDRKDHITAVLTWGVADDHTWLDNFVIKNRKDHPLLFDLYGEPKEAVDMILDF